MATTAPTTAPAGTPTLSTANTMLAPASSSPSSSASSSLYPSSSSSTLPPTHRQPPTQPQPHSHSAPRFLPGFIATTDNDSYSCRSASPRWNYSSEPDSPTGLPYLRDSPGDHPAQGVSAAPSPSSSSQGLTSGEKREPPSGQRSVSKPPPIVPTVPEPGPHRGTSTSTAGSESRDSSVARPMIAPLMPRKEARSPVLRKRPVPLVLGKAKEAMGIDEGIEVHREGERERERERERPVTSVPDRREANRDSLTNELKDLSLLRKTVRQNLLARPVESPLTGSESGGSTSTPTPDLSCSSSSFLDSPDASFSTITVSALVAILRSPNPAQQLLVIDIRPLGAFLESHLPRSANISIPSLIFKRFRRSSGTGAQSIGWDVLGGFVTTQEGKGVWESVHLDRPVEAVILGGEAGLDDMGRVIYGIMQGHVKRGSVRVLQCGWAAVMASEDAAGLCVSGNASAGEAGTTRQGDLAPLAPPLPHGAVPPPPRSAPAYDMLPLPPILPSSPPCTVTHRPSLPSLRGVATKRTLPSLSISGGGGAQQPGGTQRRTPKLSLNLDRPLRSATLGAFPRSDVPPTPAGDGHLLGGAINARSPAFSLNIPKSPYHSSFHTLCHEQSQMPPSPSSFGDVRPMHSQGEEEYGLSTRVPWSNATPTPRAPGGYSPAGPGMRFSESAPSATLLSSSEGGAGGAGRNGMAPFVVSTILPSFLYLGPDIATPQDVEVLRRLGVKRILNVAKECDDDQGLGLREEFKYQRVPMRDIVEESGVAQGMRDACDFLDDARLHSAPTYVHCQVGRSRSVTVVLAYLIHANAWTLKTSYAYVAERRKGISPNIGFVAELMQFEEVELGLKQSGGVHGEGGGGRKVAGGGGGGGGAGRGNEDDGGKGGNPRYMRESLPPTWSASVDTYGRPPKVSSIGMAGAAGVAGEEDEGKQNGAVREERERERERYGDEREVRKNGQWVHHRRAPVDRTTLQPGRRMSKAGLESLRPLNTTVPSPKMSSAPSPGAGSRPPPGGEGPLSCV